MQTVLAPPPLTQSLSRPPPRMQTRCRRHVRSQGRCGEHIAIWIFPFKQLFKPKIEIGSIVY